MKKITLFLITVFMFSTLSLLHAQCPGGETNVKISIQTDNYGSETSWTLTHESGTPAYESGGPYTDINGGQLYVKNVCIPLGTPVKFTINDEYGDGMCCSYGNGYYKIELLGYTFATGGEFGSSESVSFVVDTPLVRDMSVTAVNLMEYISVGNVNITGKIKSMGGDTVTSYDLNYSVNGGTPVTHSFTSQTIYPFTTANFNHPTPYNASASGNYIVKVWASNINGAADLNVDNDTMTTTFTVVSQAPPKYAVLEVATGAWCGYCPDGAVKFKQVLESYPNAIGYNIHNGDAMAFADGNSVNSAYASGYPNGYVDRFVFPDGTGVGLSRSLWNAKTSERLTHVSPVAVDVTNTYNQSTRQVTVTVSATFYANLGEEFRFNALIVEDSLTGTGTGWNQTNNYNSTVGHPMYGLGNPIVGYYHRYVLKAMLGGAFGSANSIPASVTDGSTYTKEFTYTLPSTMKEKDVKIIGMVQKYNSNVKKRAILNAKKVNLEGFTAINEPDFIEDLVLYPNPASSQTNISFKTNRNVNTEITVFNFLGQQIINSSLSNINSGYYTYELNTRNLPKGIYNVVIHFDNQTVCKKLIVD